MCPRSGKRKIKNTFIWDTAFEKYSCKVQYTSVSRLINRGMFALLQHWLATCQCAVTWYHTDGHVSETQTTRRAATRSQQTHTDTQQRPLEERGKIINKTQSTTFWKYDSVEWIRLQCLRDQCIRDIGSRHTVPTTSLVTLAINSEGKPWFLFEACLLASWLTLANTLTSALATRMVWIYLLWEKSFCTKLFYGCCFFQCVLFTSH